MSNQSLQFKRVASMSGETLTVGAVYFEDNTGLIHICTSTGEVKTYSGIKDVTWNSSTHVLTFTKSTGDPISLDFDNLVDYADFDNLVKGAGLLRQTDGTYRLGANGTGISGTNYINTSDSSTISGALKTLDAQLKTVTDNSGVISLGGAKGVLNLKGDNTDTGTINLTMTASADSSILSASIVDPSSAAYKTVEYFVGIDSSTDASTDNTIKGAKKYTAEVLGPSNDTSNHATVYGTRKWVEETIGDGNDASTAVTVHGAINKAQAVKTELLGNAASDTSASKTIEGLIKKIEDTSTNTTMHLYSGESGETPATHVTADGSTYRLVQGTTTVATFNIEKDSFVQDASVVYFATDADASAGTGDPNAKAGHYIHLVIKTTSGTTEDADLWIPAETLVDSYTADNTNKNVTVTVNNTTNKISAEVAISDGTHLVQHNNSEVTLATIAGQTVNAKIASLENTANNTAGGVKITETVNNGSAELSARIVDGAVTTAKIVDGNVTEAKLSSDVSTKLNGAVQTVTGETAISNPSTNYIDVKVSATKTGTDVALSTTYSLTTHDVSTATSSSTGVATAYDVQDYVKKYVAEQLVWASWPTAPAQG